VQPKTRDEMEAVRQGEKKGGNEQVLGENARPTVEPFPPAEDQQIEGQGDGVKH
jgi:hypothetical protein